MKLVSLINSYDLVIFDFDGVIVDSNQIKKKCIYMSVKKHTSESQASEFTEYFVSNNGIPRRIKIEKYFNKKRSQKILNDYNKLLKEKESEIKLNKEFLEIIKKIKIKKIILSGGERDEIESILDRNSLADEFEKILCSPLTKDENLKKVKASINKLFIGDSRIDYEVSLSNDLDFIFYTKFTQEKHPYSFLDKNVASINNLTS